MITAFKEKAEDLFRKVVTDPRWDVAEETQFSVFGFTFYGYCFGVGRLLYFLDAETINAFVTEKLVALGAGAKYAGGLVEAAYSTFEAPSESLNAQLVGIGHAHFAAADMTELVNAFFKNAVALK